MNSLRRCFVLSAVAACCALVSERDLANADNSQKEATKMFGLIGKIIAVDGKRDELIAILLQGTKQMPGCLSYVVAKDAADANGIWVTEVWDDQASHKASLSLPAVRQAITKGRPLIVKFDQSVTTQPVGGHGLATGKSR